MNESKIVITKDRVKKFNEWYLEVVMKTELLDYYQVSGCYIMLPFSYEMWEMIQACLDKKIKSIGVKNVYFPLLIPETYLNKESNHIQGFTPEVIWVSKTGNDVVNQQDRVKLAIRPTSECAIYPTFADKIKSTNDLPLQWNQWCNVMRWEFTSATPFIRSKEFLWQEGHCAFASVSDMQNNIRNVLTIYKQVYEDLLCVPVFLGKKIESEKFAGAEETFSVETFIPDANKSIQCATAHNLGKNFSKIFDIKYQLDNGNSNSSSTTDYVIQTSWGFTTRSIGTVIMTHGDNIGLILPPLLAPVQIVIIPIKYQKSQELNQQIINLGNDLVKMFSEKFRVKLDNSDRNPGWKYYHWETKGVPLRIEIGPKDIEQNEVTFCNRITGGKSKVKVSDLNCFLIEQLFDEMKTTLFDNAYQKQLNSTVFTSSKDDIIKLHGEKKLISVILCDDKKCDDKIRHDYELKPFCRPLDLVTLESLESLDSLNQCIICGLKGKFCFLSKTF